MSPKPRIRATNLDSQCAIARSLGVLSDSWSFLLLREAHLGQRTFAQFRDTLGIATDVLSTRLAALVDHGVLEKTPYQPLGQRTRYAYTLTPAGEELKIVLIAMQQWGEKHVPSDAALRVRPLTSDTRSQVQVQLADEDGTVVDHDDVEFVRVDPATGEPQTDVLEE